MKKKILAILMSAILIIGIGIVTYGSASNDMIEEKNAASSMSVQAGFEDVPEEIWYSEAVKWSNEKGLMSGVNDKMFAPDMDLTRVMLATVLFRAEGSPEAKESDFVDVVNGEWYEKAVDWASANGIMNGYSKEVFGVIDNITRQQLASTLYRYSGSPAVKSLEQVEDASEWAREGMSWAVENGILNERENGYEPLKNATRAEVAFALFTLLGPKAQPIEIPVHEKTSLVYFTEEITPDGMMRIYEALGRKAEGKNIAVKLSTGEAGGNYFLSPELIKNLVQEVNGTIVECNTAYGGSRANTAMHRQVAEDHGFTAIADVDIMDAEGTMTIPIEGGKNLTEDIVGSHFANYDFFVVLSHFKGHAMGGFGGAIKNISIGIASAEGKSWIHSAGTSTTNPWGGEQDAFLESMAEAAKGVSDSLQNGENILYISVMNNLSIDCDCDANPSKPDIHDIGILASTDPVALDQACVDLIYQSSEEGKASFIERIESRNGVHTLEHAEKIGLGSRSYNLVNIDG